MAPKKSKTTKRDQKHGKNGKKGGLSGSSFFTWFMVIALLGVWTSVAVVWFDLVDYEDFIAKAKDFRYNLSEALQGKLGDYDADGDGDFDVDDAKVLLGFAQSPKMEKATKAPDLTGGITKTKTKEEGLKERFVSEKNSEDLDETDSTASEISDLDLEDVINAIKDSAQYDHDVNDIEDALDDHDTQDDAASEFSLEDALEPNVYEAVHTEPEVKEPEEEPAIEEQVVEEQEEEEPAAEEEVIDEVTEQVLAHEPAATEDDVEEETFTHHDEHEAEEHQEHEAEEHQEHEAEEHQEHEAEEHQEHEEEEHQEPEPVYEQEVEETETEFLNAPNTETEEPLDVEYEAEPLAAEEAGETPEPAAEEEYEAEIAAEEQDPQDEAKEPENQEEYETHEEPVLTGEEPSEDGTESYDEVNEYTQTELEEEEPAELPDTPEPDEEIVPEHTEEHPTETTEDIFTGGEEEVNEAQNEEPESPHEHVEVEQNEIPENPVVDDRPSERAQEQKTEPLEGQQGEHAAKKKKPKLLNKFDKTIKAELDAAEKLRKKGKVEDALKAFELLVTKYPQSPRARYGKAQSEDDLAEKMRSNEILLRAIGTYEEVTGLPNVPSDLVKLALKRRANRQQFLGRMRGSILTLQKLVQLYPEDIALRNDLGVGYLLLGDNQKAKEVYEEVLSMDPNNGFAKVHYGFILKAENKIIESIPYLKEGLLSGEPGTDDGRFYFHLGDALQRAGDKEAYTWYEIGHKKGHFASVWQRSLYNVDGLRAQPWWTAKETGYSDLVRALEANWKTIRDEGLAVMDKSKGLFLPEDENLREKGDWSQYTLWQQGRQNEKSCKAAPKTCALLERFPESTGCRRGQIKYSVMHPGTHVWPHTGPTNCRLRMHLGLVIPNQGCRIRCANDTRSWEEGKVLIFDDSFEHEVWQDSDSYRLIFIVDVWHPELTQHQRRTLPAI